MTENTDAAEAIASYLEENYPLDGVEILPDEYHYSCLPLCLLDAIFSIGVRYSSTQNVVSRYCDYVGIQKYREKGNGEEIEHSLVDMLGVFESLGSSERFAETVVMNAQLTSSRGGILKAEAVRLCAQLLSESGIATIADFQNGMNSSIEEEFASVKGQGSGVSLRYLKMLCGKDDEAKPDRHVLRFIARFLGREPDANEAVELLGRVTDQLKSSHPAITLREVDYLIWSEMAQR